MWRKENSHILLGIKIGAAIMENSMNFLGKKKQTKNATTILIQQFHSW